MKKSNIPDLPDGSLSLLQVNLPNCVLPNAYSPNVNTSNVFHRRVFLPTCQKGEVLKVEMQFACLSDDVQKVEMSIHRNANLPKCSLPKSQLVEMPICRNVNLSKCQLA